MSYVNIQDRRSPFLVRYISDLLTYRHLCWNLVGSDLRSRFRRSHLGILWAVIQPLAFSLVIAAVWGRVFEAENYWGFALYVYSGIILWDYFATSVTVSQDALTSAEGYIKQTRIPFLIFQVRTPIIGGIILLFGLAGFFILQAALMMTPFPGLHLLLIPPALALVFLFMAPISIIMSVVGTAFRDTRYISQVVVQALFFISPVMLDRGLLDHPSLSFLEYLNPMVPLMDLFRAPLLHGELWRPSAVLIVTCWIAALWVGAGIVSARTGRRLVFAL